MRQEIDEREFRCIEDSGEIDLSNELEKDSFPINISMVLDAFAAIAKLMFR